MKHSEHPVLNKRGQALWAMSLFPLFFSLPLINAKRSLSALERVS